MLKIFGVLIIFVSFYNPSVSLPDRVELTEYSFSYSYWSHNALHGVIII